MKFNENIAATNLWRICFSSNRQTSTRIKERIYEFVVRTFHCIHNHENKKCKEHRLSLKY